MEFIKKERIKIGMLFIGVFLVASFLIVNEYNFGSNIHKTPIATPNKETLVTLPLSTIDAVRKIYQKYDYPGPRFIASDDKRVWFVPLDESDVCRGQYHYVELATGEEIESGLSACQQIPISDSYPFYIEHFIYWSEDVKTLDVVNLLTLERRTVYTLDDGETMLSGCYEATYGSVCKADVYITNGELLINVHKEYPRKMDDVYENKELLRTDHVDLLYEFGIK